LIFIQYQYGTFVHARSHKMVIALWLLRCSALYNVPFHIAEDIMTIIDAVLLGLLQGLTEFLPISSSAHLRIAGPFLSTGADPGAAFTAVVQIGTEAAVLIYFRQDIWRIAKAWLRSFSSNAINDRSDARVGWLVLLGTLPIAIFGLLFKEAIEGSLRNLYLTATMLIAFGIILGIADRCGAKLRTIDQISWRDGLMLGLAQAMALVPGVSRSGGTISAGLLLGFTREAAARYSFLLAIPAVLASGFFQLMRNWDDLSAAAAIPTAVATLVAFGSGYGVIMGFLRLISTRTYMVFVWYRIILGLCLFLSLGSGAISAT
jgi:undecaprenyl-diphosphatase